MHVQQIERLRFKNFQHFGSQRQCVRRVVEQRVGRYFNLVEMNMRIVGIHANRRRVADKVHVVIARRQFRAEFGGHHAGAAVGGIASYADAHDEWCWPFS